MHRPSCNRLVTMPERIASCHDPLMHRILLLAVLACCAAALPATDLILRGVDIPPGATREVTWSWQGFTRSARVHVPSGYTGAAALPLVVVIHGGGGTSSAIEASSGWSAQADAVGWLVAYPQGLSLNSSGVDDPANELAYWANDRGTRPDQFGIDDVGMITGLVDSVAAATALDADRVYAMGMSNGGMMVHRLGRDSARYWAGLSSVSGSYTATPSVSPFAPSFPVSVFIIHGSSDTIVPYAGGAVSGQGGAVIGAEATRDLWLQRDGITAAAVATAIPDTVSDGCTSMRYDYTGGLAGTRVSFIRVDGGNHSWPGGSGSTGAGAGSKTDDFSATTLAQAFFAAARRQGEIALSRGGVAFASGGVDAVTGTVIGTRRDLAYTVANQGGGLLTCSGLVVTASSGCTVAIAGSPASVASGASGTATVQVTPTAAAWSVALSLASDDADEATYVWTASGTAAATSGGSGAPASGGGGGGCGAGAAGGLLLALALAACRFNPAGRDRRSCSAASSGRSRTRP